MGPSNADALMLLMRWCTDKADVLTLLIRWCCLCADAADALMLLMRWCCWCADAADTLIQLMHWCCCCADAADVLMLLMGWCCWCADAADVLMLLMMLNQDGSTRGPFIEFCSSLPVKRCTNYHKHCSSGRLARGRGMKNWALILQVIYCYLWNEVIKVICW